jgi:hypothetical protein
MSMLSQFEFSCKISGQIKLYYKETNMPNTNTRAKHNKIKNKNEKKKHNDSKDRKRKKNCRKEMKKCRMIYNV